MNLTTKSDTIYTNIRINGPKLTQIKEYVWAITKIIFNYARSPQVKRSQLSKREIC